MHPGASEDSSTHDKTVVCLCLALLKVLPKEGGEVLLAVPSSVLHRNLVFPLLPIIQLRNYAPLNCLCTSGVLGTL